MRLSPGEQIVDLAHGWSCTVAATSGNEARTTVCQKGAAKFEFTVQCERSHPKDHVQVRFRDDAGKVSDFIEVGCEFGGEGH